MSIPLSTLVAERNVGRDDLNRKVCSLFNADISLKPEMNGMTNRFFCATPVRGRRNWMGCIATFLAGSVVVANDDLTAHTEGLREHAPQVFVIEEVTIVPTAGQRIENGKVVVRDRKIVAVGADVDVPVEAHVIRLPDHVVYPGFFDAYAEVSFSESSQRPATAYWNPQIRTEFAVANAIEAKDLNAQSLRRHGFVARLIAPRDGIIRGQAALYHLGSAEMHQLALNSQVAVAAELTIPRSRGDRSQYPNSPMGAVALSRQHLYDALWYRDAHQAVETDPALSLPEANVTLDAAQTLLNRSIPLMVETSNELFALRADDFAREFELDLIIVGSGHEYRRLADITQTKRPLIVPVNFPKAPHVGSPETAAAASLEALMHWDHAPENLARLHAHGAEILLTTHRLGDPGKFLKNLRLAVNRGFPAEAALRSLTSVPAARFGVSEQLGTIEPGKLASFVITDGDLFAKDSKIVETWVDGERFEHDPHPEVNIEGDWKLTPNTVPDGVASTLIVNLSGTDKPKGKIRADGSSTETENLVDIKSLEREGSRLTGRFAAQSIGIEGTATWSVTLEKNSDTWSGTIGWPNGTASSFEMTRIPNSAATPSDNADKATEADETPPENSSGTATAENTDPADEKAEDEQADRPDLTQPASFPVNYPLGAYGKAEPPARPETVAFIGGTVWTSGPQGTLEKATVIIADGKIVAVGQNLEVPNNAVRIDVTGRHLTPGLIDCHSHIASDGGINESAQAITCEVRIADFLDCDDIDIYWQLAGGLTTSNILHGSANPIGGQNQVIKMRWGANYEQLRFREAPAGVKFALGENVKQSNWGDEYTTRYPQTRMGVEQIMRDEFLEAQEYAAAHQFYQQTQQGLPPRVDLELQAIAEVLAGERWIHCHSYRQDEILALIRTLNDFDITIGSFQHILEGYKVADAMAAHGATGSSFSDWWAYKVEVQDAIPYNGKIMHDQGIVVSFNSDDGELGRRMNQEAAKAVKYGGIPPAEALKFVTLNPAIQLRIDQYVGSLEPGKHADLAIWSGDPLSNLSRCEQTWIDGRKYFDREQEQSQRDEVQRMRTTLIQKILDSRAPMLGEDEEDADPSSLWPRHDEFCHTHDEEHTDHGHH